MKPTLTELIAFMESIESNDYQLKDISMQDVAAIKFYLTQYDNLIGPIKKALADAYESVSSSASNLSTQCFCPVCYGEGMVAGAKCGNCNGQGRVFLTNVLKRMPQAE